MNADPFPPFSSSELPSEQTSEPDRAESNIPPTGQRTWNPWRGLVAWIRENTYSPEWLPKQFSYLIFGYLAAVLLEGTAAGLVLLILSLFPSLVLSGILFALGLVLVVVGWGVGPGLFATLASMPLLYIVVLPHSESSFADDWAVFGDLVLYLVVGVSISLLAGQIDPVQQLLKHFCIHPDRICISKHQYISFEAQQLRGSRALDLRF